jgi:hypothetical protein
MEVLVGRFYTPRSELRDRRQNVAGLGARHPIVADERVDAFFWALDERWAQILPEREPVDRALTGLPEKRFRLYDDPEKMGVTVLERRIVTKFAERRRRHWTPNDIGRTRLEIANELGRLGAGDDIIDITFTGYTRVGEDDQSNKRGAKFALVTQEGQSALLDQPEVGLDGDEHDPYSLLVAEHNIMVEGLTGVFHDFRYPYPQYVPKMTVGRVYRDARPAQVEACEEQLAELLKEQPLTVSLEPVVLFHNETF